MTPTDAAQSTATLQQVLRTVTDIIKAAKTGEKPILVGNFQIRGDVTPAEWIEFGQDAIAIMVGNGLTLGDLAAVLEAAGPILELLK